jgi:hypothetical protein
MSVRLSQKVVFEKSCNLESRLSDTLVVAVYEMLSPCNFCVFYDKNFSHKDTTDKRKKIALCPLCFLWFRFIRFGLFVKDQLSAEKT